jgi:hypothetical protein
MTFGAVIFTLFAIAANVGDILTTQRGLALGAKEANPIAKWLFEKTSVRAAWWLKGLLVIALVWTWFNASIEIYMAVCFVMFATGSYAVASNTGVIQKILKRKAKT